MTEDIVTLNSVHPQDSVVFRGGIDLLSAFMSAYTNNRRCEAIHMRSMPNMFSWNYGDNHGILGFGTAYAQIVGDKVHFYCLNDKILSAVASLDLIRSKGK